MPEKKLGELLISSKLVTEEQFQQALEMQALTPALPIGQLLCQLNHITKKDLDYVLDFNNKRRKLGEILISQNLINKDRLESALTISRDEKIPLGRALIKQHLIEEEHLALAIASQHDLKFLNLSSVRLDMELAGLINATYAQRHRLVPVKRDKMGLVIAMAYPLRRDELLQLESCCQATIIPVIAKETDIISAQQRLFKIAGTFSKEELHFELSEDQMRDSVKSKYVTDFISADVDYLTKRIITTGIKECASDIHLESTEHGMTIRYRIDGVLQRLDMGNDMAQIGANARQIVSKIKILCDMDIAERRRPQDSNFKMKVSKAGSVRSVDFRVSTVPTPFGENLAIRILDRHSEGITLEKLGYSPEHIEALYKALEKPTGIFLLTGPTGSGKSSTLYAVLSRINTPGVKTLTVEDPIEYGIDGITQTEVNEVIGNTFAKLLRAFLRQDPDNIMVGEVRDQETASIAMRAALTGHTVLSTLHTNDSTSAVTRLIDMGVEPSLIATTLRCILAQRLVRAVCSQCKTAFLPSRTLLSDFGIPPDTKITFHQGKGCRHCNFSGFSGRLPIVELWLPSREELLFINRKPDSHSLRKQVFNRTERLTMIEDGYRRVVAGETTLEELLRVVPYEQIEAGRDKIGKYF